MITENKIYNPAAQTKEWLIEHFVVRTRIFEKIFEDIRKNKMKYPGQNYIIQGQRGMGKTTLLLRLKYEIEQTPELSEWLVPVFFNEESYDLTSLSNLWEKLLKYLDNLWQTGGTYYTKTDNFLGKADYEKKCFELLLEILKERKKKLAIFFDNFGSLFLDNLEEKEQRRLREILMNCPDIRIIGASHVVIEDLHDYSKPFYEFFRIINLDGLTKEETLDVIVKLQERAEVKVDIERNKAKIETLAILTGGVIRTIMLIYEVVLADQDGTALNDLETILDRITPLYKHRIEDLPVQQRKIVDVIAKKWDAISAKEISESIRDNGQMISTKLISAQLNQLEKNNIIEKKQTNTKNHLYQVKERFFNIWYLMRNGDRYDRCRVKWLTKFLELFYSDGFESYLHDHIKHLRSGKYYPSAAIMIAEALSNSSKMHVKGLTDLLKETSYILTAEQKKLLPDITRRILAESENLTKEGKWNEALELLDSIVSKDNYVLIQIGLINFGLGNLDKVKEIVQLVVPNTEGEKAGVGLLYLNLGEYAKALELLVQYKEIDGLIQYSCALCCINLNRSEEAIKFLTTAISVNFNEAYEALATQLLNAERMEEAERYLIEGAEKGVSGLVAMLIEFYLFKNKEADRLDKAKNLLDQHMLKKPDDATLIYLLGLFKYFKGELEDALEKFEFAHNLLSKEKSESVRSNMCLVLLIKIYSDTKIDKVKATSYTNELFLQPIPDFFQSLNACVLIWNGKFNEGVRALSLYFDSDYKQVESYMEDFAKMSLLMLITKKQYHNALNLFHVEKYHLMDKYKPIYYALMQLMKDEFPNEFIKMGDELKQPVEDILKRVQEMTTLYE